MASTTAFKVTFEGEIRRFALQHEHASWPTLRTKLGDIFGLSQFRATYTDVDGDRVALDSTDELLELLRQAAGAPVRLQLDRTAPSPALGDGAWTLVEDEDKQLVVDARPEAVTTAAVPESTITAPESTTATASASTITSADAEPEAVEPEAVEPEAVEPEVVEPEVVEPEPTSPETVSASTVIVENVVDEDDEEEDDEEDNDNNDNNDNDEEKKEEEDQRTHRQLVEELNKLWADLLERNPDVVERSKNLAAEIFAAAVREAAAARDAYIRREHERQRAAEEHRTALRKQFIAWRDQQLREQEEARKQWAARREQQLREQEEARKQWVAQRERQLREQEAQRQQRAKEQQQQQQCAAGSCGRAAQLRVPAAFVEDLHILSALGFRDVPLNVNLLHQHQGDLESVVAALTAAY